MSLWTHVCCRILTTTPLPDNFFGKELNLSSSLEEWSYAWNHQEEYLPLGSEGSMIYYKRNGEEKIFYETIIIGSLRDVSNTETLMTWFKDKVKSINDIRILEASFTGDSDATGIEEWRYFSTLNREADFVARYRELKDQGLKQSEIAKSMNRKTPELRRELSEATNLLYKKVGKIFCQAEKERNKPLRG